MYVLLINFLCLMHSFFNGIELHTLVGYLCCYNIRLIESSYVQRALIAKRRIILQQHLPFGEFCGLLLFVGCQVVAIPLDLKEKCSLVTLTRFCKFSLT